MKRMFLLSFLLVPTIAFSAIDYTKTDEHSLNDLMRIAPEGKFVGGTGLDRSSNGYSIEVLEIETNSVKDKKTNFSQFIEYSIKDNWKVGASVDYVTSDTSENTVEFGPSKGQTTAYKSNGLEDPTLGTTYRIFNQTERPVNFDISFSYSPKTQDKISPTEDKKGNEARGGSAISFEAEIGQKMREFQWSGTTMININGEQESKNASTSKKNIYESSSSLGIRVNAQWSFTPLLSLNVGLAYISFGEEVQKNQSTGTKVTYDTCDVVAVSTQLIFKLIPNKLVGIASIVGVSGSDRDVKSGLARAVIVNNSGANVGVGALYQF